MDGPHLYHVAALLADPARAAMVWALTDGSSRSAGELAFAANVSASSASRHLAALVDAGLLQVRTSGRERRFRIVDEHAARLIEAVAMLTSGNEKAR